MAGERVEVAIELLHVHLHVGHGLRAVDEYGRAVAVRDACDLGYRVNGAERVGNMHDGDQLGARAQQFFEFVQQQLAALVDGRYAQDGLLLLAQDLPGHDVGVVLHGGDHNLIAGLDVPAAVCVGDQVDALGSAPHKDNLAPIGSVDEALYLDPRLFVMPRGALAQFVYAAMDVGIIHLVELVHRVEHHLRFLGGGGVVQIDQRFAVDALVQYREVLASAC